MRASLTVVGDVLLDVDVLTHADRLSPDGPVPVLDEVSRRVRPGGAALTALLAAQDARVDVVLVAPVPDDDSGRRIRELVSGSVTLVALPCSGATPVKTRLRSNGHTVARLDNGGGVAITEIPEAAAAALRDADCVLVSDYGGAVTSDPDVRELLTDRAAARAVVWDPHPRGGPPVRSATLVTPNVAEASAATGISGDGLADLRRTTAALTEQWQARSVAVTLGSRGAYLSAGGDEATMFPARRAASGDACGAGDCFAAAAATEIALGAVASEAVAHAVESATAFVAGGGVAELGTPRPGATETPVQDDVIVRVRARGGVVVATGGCFDLLHAGHVEMLEAARSLGDCLIVCLNSDASVRRLKGAPRPLQSQADRARLLAALRAVDAVVVFDEDTPMALLDRLRPDVWVKGGDYTSDQLPEAELVRQWGGEVVTVGYLGGRSTTRLLAQAQR